MVPRSTLMLTIALSLLPACYAAAPLSHALVVTARLEELPGAHYQELKEPGSGTTLPAGEIVVCTGGWTRYRLSDQKTVDGRSRPNTVALIYTDLNLGGYKLVNLERLALGDARRYGARYNVTGVMQR